MNDYSFPLRGAWVVAVGPGFSEPHRWAPNEEFALDSVRTSASGKTCRGEWTKPSDCYAWGEDVVAAADGVVVSTVADQKETSERLRKPGESADAFLQRTMAEQQKLLSEGAAGVAGNLVAIRLEGGEYSLYAHLAEGSVVEKAGEKVSKGQKLGKVGHTGNSTEPHLHFGIVDGPDPLYARSLPVRRDRRSEIEIARLRASARSDRHGIVPGSSSQTQDSALPPDVIEEHHGRGGSGGADTLPERRAPRRLTVTRCSRRVSSPSSLRRLLSFFSRGGSCRTGGGGGARASSTARRPTTPTR